MLPITPEVQRFSMAIGALMALAWKDRHGIIPGGIVVPGFLLNTLVLSLPWCTTIVLIAALIQRIYQSWLERVEHQRRQPMYILGLLSLLISTPIAWLYIQIGLLPSSLDSVSGTFLPGVIAFNLHRQGLPRVIGGMMAVTGTTALLTGVLVWIGSNLLMLDFDQIDRYYLHADSLKLRAQLLQFLVALLMGSLLYKRTGLRSGGYMVAPIAASLLLEPLSAGLFAMGCFGVEAGIRWLMQHSLIIGLQRYVAALLLSIVYVWGMELIFIQLGMEALPFQGNHLLVIIAILSYANDAVLEGAWRVLPWMAIMLASSLLTLLVTQQLVTLVS